MSGKKFSYELVSPVFLCSSTFLEWYADAAWSLSLQKQGLYAAIVALGLLRCVALPSTMADKLCQDMLLSTKR